MLQFIEYIATFFIISLLEKILKKFIGVFFCVLYYKILSLSELDTMFSYKILLIFLIS
jgi:hypothetical protein